MKRFGVEFGPNVEATEGIYYLTEFDPTEMGGYVRWVADDDGKSRETAMSLVEALKVSEFKEKFGYDLEKDRVFEVEAAYSSSGLARLPAGSPQPLGRRLFDTRLAAVRYRVEVLGRLIAFAERTSHQDRVPTLTQSLNDAQTELASLQAAADKHRDSSS
jgi:hypothetical protein